VAAGPETYDISDLADVCHLVCANGLRNIPLILKLCVWHTHTHTQKTIHVDALKYGTLYFTVYILS